MGPKWNFALTKSPVYEKQGQNYLERLYPTESEIRTSFCSCLAVPGMNTTESLNVKTILLLLIDGSPDNILELPEEARLLLCNFKTVRKVESKI